MAEIARLEAVIAGDIKPLVASLGEAQTALKGFAETGKAAVVPLNTGLDTTAKATSVAAAEFKEMGAVMSGIASIGITAGITAGLLILKPAIEEIISDIVHLGDVSKEATEILKQQGEEFAKNAGNAQAEITQIQALIAVARDENLTREARNNALQKAQEMYPGYLGNIKLEEVNSAAAEKAINNLTLALIRKAKAEGASSLISKTFAQIIEIQNKPLKEQLTLLDKLFSFQFGGQGKGIIETTRGLANQSKTLSELNGLLNSYNKILFDVTHEQAVAGDFKLLDPDPTPKIKKVKEAVDEWAQSLNNIRHLLFKLGEEQITAPVKIQQFVEVGSLSETDAEASIIRMRDALTKSAKKVFSTQGILSDVPLLNDEEVQANFTRIQNNAQALAKILSGTLAPAIDQIFNALANGQDAFTAIEQGLARLIVKLVETVIEAAILAAILSALGGGSFTSIFQSILGFNKSSFPFPKFAAGGIVTGATIAQVGEAGPEAIIPLSQIGNLLGNMGGTQRIEVIGRISGNDIVLINNRQNLRNSRSYGSNFNSGING